MTRAELRREAVLAWIHGHPGTTFRATGRGTGLAAGSLQHYLRILKRRGLVQEVNHQHRRLFFAAGTPLPPPEVATLLQEGALWVLRDWLAQNPASSQRQVLDHLQEQGWSRSTTQHRLDRLVQAGLVSRSYRGRFLEYRAQGQDWRVMA